MFRFFNASRLCLACFFIMSMSLPSVGQNPGFESTPIGNSNGWSLEVSFSQPTWAWGSSTNRSGGRRLDASTTTSNNRNAAQTSYSVTAPASGTNYIHVIGYYRRTAGSVRVEARGTTSINGTLESGATGQWNRATASGAATNGGTYHPRFSFQGSSSASYAFDDIIIYTSTSAGVDLTAPNAASSLGALDNGTDIELTWSDGTDAATNISGIDGTLIIRIAGDHTGAIPTPQPQTWYSTNSGIGPTTIVAGANTWTVISNGAASGAYTNVSASGGIYTYVVYMRDKAFNYSAGTAIYCNNCTAFCTGTPAPGNTLVDDATPCIGDDITLSLQNTTPGNSVTYQWQRATNAAFTTGLNNLGTSSTQVTAAVTGTVYYRCQVTCSASASTGTSTAVAVTGQTCYCASGATETTDGRIQRVRLNTIDQTSPNTCQTYTDYTTVSTTVVPGSSYSLIINQGTCSANTGHRVRAWIDFNRDGIFSDPSERVFDADMGSFDPSEVSQAVTIPNSAVGGPAGMRVVSRVGTSSNPQPCGTYTRGETEDYTINICDMVWNGGTTAWGTASNWSCGVLPTSLNNVTIPTAPSGGNQPTVNVVSAAVRDISVHAGATVTISSGNALTVHGNLTNNGTVNVASGGSLVQTATSTLAGTGIYNVTRAGSAIYDYWSSPITNASTGLLGSTVYEYQPGSGTADPGDDAFDPGWATAGGSMAVGKGYAAYGAGTRTFTGTVNNGQVDAAVVHASNPTPTLGGVPYNLIGNPYPSAVNVGDFLTLNSSKLATGAVYLWDDPGSSPYVTGNYATLNNATYIAGGGNTPNPGPRIGSLQGFKVEVNATVNTPGNGFLRFTNAMRTATNTSVLFRQAERKLLWLSTVSATNSYNQLAVGFFEDGTDGEDWGYDAPKLNALGALSFFSYMDGSPYGIQVYGELEPERVVPLGLNSQSQTMVTIALDSTENITEDVILEDRHMGIFHDLRQSSYVFQSASTLYEDRFFLHFAPQMVTSIDGSPESESTIYMHDGRLFLSTSEMFKGAVRMVDISGRMVWQATDVTVDPSGRSFDMQHLSRGVYVVMMEGREGTFNSKVTR